MSNGLLRRLCLFDFAKRQVLPVAPDIYNLKPADKPDADKTPKARVCAPVPPACACVRLLVSACACLPTFAQRQAPRSKRPWQARVIDMLDSINNLSLEIRAAGAAPKVIALSDARVAPKVPATDVGAI